MTNKDNFLKKFEKLDEELNNMNSEELYTDDLIEVLEDPHFSKFSNKEIHLLTNFTITEFDQIFFMLGNEFALLRSTKGKKPALSDKDLLLLLLSYLKCYDNYNKIALNFSISTSTAKNYISKMIKEFSTKLKEKFIFFIKKEMHSELNIGFRM